MNDLLDTLFEEMDLLDTTELDPQDKIVYSKELTDRIRSEIRKEIAKMPIGKIISKVLSKEADRQRQSEATLKTSFSKEMGNTKNDLKNEVSKLETLLNELTDKTRKRYDELKSLMLNQPSYTLGGFSPQFNDLNIGDPSTNGSWRVVISGTDLLFQRRESNAWTTKGSYTP